VNSQVPTTPDPYPREDEVDLRELLSILVSRKIFICGFTLFVTILAVAYTLYLPSIYEANIHLKSPSNSSVLKLRNLMGETTLIEKQIVYTAFLDNMFSGKIQKEAFISNKYSDRFKLKNKNTIEFDIFFDRFIQTIKSKTLKRGKSESTYGDYYEEPLIISMTGKDPEIISDFLNDLSVVASKRTIDEFLAIRKESIRYRLQKLSEGKKLLINKSKQDRLSKIIRLKAERDETVRRLSNEIDKLKIKARNDQLRKIDVLSDAMSIAEELGVIQHNFNLTSRSRVIRNIRSIKASKTKKVESEGIDITWKVFPEWYLFGKDALSKEIGALKKRTNDDIYTPEIAELRLKLETIPLTEEIKTLEQRTSENPYIDEINELDIEFETLSAIELNPIGIDVVEIYRRSVPQKNPKGYKKLLIVLLTFVGGLLLSSFLAVLMSVNPRSQ